MISIEKDPNFREYKRCTSCRKNKEDVEYFNFDDTIIRLCKGCRAQLIELLKSTL